MATMFRGMPIEAFRTPKMTYEDFLNVVARDIQERDPSLTAEATEVKKPQGSYRGIFVKKKDARMSVSFNLAASYAAVQEGTPLSDVQSQIRKMVDEEIRRMPDLALDLSNYQEVKERLVMQAVPTERNGQMLSEVPHKEIGDISIVYRIFLGTNGGKELSALVTNKMVTQYGVTLDEVIRDAETSAPLQKPLRIQTMAECLFGLTEGLLIPDFPIPPLWIASVETGNMGAGVLGYPDFLKEAAEKVGGSFFMFPSSVHELILAPEELGMSAAEMSAMVSDINQAEVAVEDQLSNTVYHYDVDADLFESASEYEARTRRSAC